MADLDSAVVRMMCAGELDGEALELVSGAGNAIRKKILAGHPCEEAILLSDPPLRRPL